MKRRFLWVMLCISVVVGTAPAQKQNWVKVPTVDEAYFGVQYIDTNSIKRPTSGTVIFLNKMGHTTTQFEVNCVEHKFRRLQENEAAWLSNGILIPAAPSQQAYPTRWDTFVNDGSVISSLANRVCSTDNPAAKKKAIKNKARKSF